MATTREPGENRGVVRALDKRGVGSSGWCLSTARIARQHGQCGLGTRAIDLVGELPHGHPGSIRMRAPLALVRHWRNGRENRRWRYGLARLYGKPWYMGCETAGSRWHKTALG